MTNFCSELHILFQSLHRHRFPFNENLIPLNGIYVLFQTGENAHGSGRIVRIGTHTGQNQLRSRLRQHFINENKDRSIFRKNIGRAILHKNNDPFLDSWELDLTSADAKKLYQHQIDLNRQHQIELDVSEYIQKNFNFVVFKVEDVNKRLKFESQIISTISLCDGCLPSSSWLGNFSPKEKIRESGLWLVNELYKEP